jgi:hypothetical protein
VFPAETYLELVEGAPLWNDEYLEVSRLLFSQKAWEKGSFTMLSARYINPSKSVNKKASSEKRKLTDIKKLDESQIETDAISRKKPKLTHTDTHQVTPSKTTKPPVPASPPKQPKQPPKTL